VHGVPARRLPLSRRCLMCFADVDRAAGRSVSALGESSAAAAAAAQRLAAR